MIIIRRLSVLLLIIICCAIIANADNNKSYKCEGNTYIISSTGRVNAHNVKSKFEYKDAKGISYPIYVSNSGSCYIIKVSNKSGKEYKHYLGSEISQDICKKLGKEYKSKKK